jgi:putative ABC transport system permease protein
MPSAAMSLSGLEEVVGGPPDHAAFLLVASDPGSGDLAAVGAIQDRFPELYAYSNAQYIQRFQAHDFAYFRQIAGVISTLALFFTFLLLTSLLTVSVNQRLGEVAGLRALGFRRRRVVAMLMWETLLSLSAGLLLAVAAGSIMAVVLDGILRDMPGLPDRLHFFVYRHEVLVQFLALMVGTAALSMVYPAWIAARLPIAATLRKEIGT